jgi:threonine dehydrogenase-like Zn-dependent dehydrogenase
MKAVGMVGTGGFDPTAFITRREETTATVEAHEAFARREEGWLETVLEVAA